MSKPPEQQIPVGVVVRCYPGVSTWSGLLWRAEALIPNAPAASWRLLRQDGAQREYLAATLPLELHPAEVEAYRAALINNPPCAWVVMHDLPDDDARWPTISGVTLSAYRAQDALDSGDGQVDMVTLPPSLLAIARDFIDRCEPPASFKKRRRRDWVEENEVPQPDARVVGAGNVYLPPGKRP